MSDEPAPSPDPKDAPAEPAPAPSPSEGPDAEELRAIETLYEAGDFREVSRRAPALAERSKEDPVRARARELASRVQLDPFVLWAWGATVLVVAGIVYYYVIR
jgi:hypothetical protein